MTPETQRTQRKESRFSHNKSGLPKIAGQLHPDFLGASTTTKASDFDSPHFFEAQDKLNHVIAADDQLTFFAFARESVLEAIPEMQESIELIVSESPWEFVEWDLQPETLISRIERVDASNSSLMLPMAVEVKTRLTLAKRGAKIHPNYKKLQEHGHRRPKHAKIVHIDDGTWFAVSMREWGPVVFKACSFIISIDFDPETKEVYSEISDFDIEGFKPADGSY